MIRDTISKINGTDNGKKIYLYSAHENNIADALIVLGIFEPFHMPTYGAYLTFEVHKINNSYGIKIYYENYTTTKPELLKLPACESFCEINKFISLIEEYFPNDDLCGISDCL
ncbi:His Phos 2 domain containing protein [Asbolus verrucosus]|uniref:His Phos 2 domain containing protein n=1 Tax=Asbolus verrucosus TaxID=1661398 RepID=A0A482VLU3_ASBVE|nr:His Phos 2 domain containing protein [Asbolus verrucosus]